MNNIKKAFENITAEETLKENTLEKVMKSINNEAKPQRKNGRFVALASACAVVVVALFGFGGYHVYAKPVSYISMEVNPSVELGINRWNKIVSEKGLNQDGEELLSRNDISGMEYQEAMEILLADEQMVGCIASGDEFTFSVATEDENMEESINSICQRHGIKYSCHKYENNDKTGGNGNGYGNGQQHKKGKHENQGGHHGKCW